MDTKQIPELMVQVARIAPFGWWKHRLKALSDQEAANDLLGDYFDQEFSLERTYGKISEYHKTTSRYPEIDAENYELFSFLGSLVLVHQQLSVTGQRQLRANVRGALLKGGLEPIAAEFRTAVHLMQQNYDVEFTDLEGKERFDLLARKVSLEIEVDCKAPSGDVGRKVHGLRFRTLVGRLIPALREIVNGGQNYLIIATLPGGLHGDRAYEDQVVMQIGLCIKNPKLMSTSTPLVDVTIQEFDIAVSPFGHRGTDSTEEVAAFLEDKFGLENVNAAIRWSPGRGAVIFVIKSAQPDKVVDGIYHQLKWSAENQFSGTRAAMLCVQLRDFTAPQLRNIAQASPNGLQKIATRLFLGERRKHLAAVSYVANARALTPRRFEFGNLRRTSYQDVGAAYVFANADHPAGAAVDTVFRQLPGAEA